MVFELERHAFACRGPGMDWHWAIVKVVMNYGEFYMMSWLYHRHWDDAVLPANYLRVEKRFNIGNQV
eukprot:12777671-Ditylum_brightwellii.AAC.1